MQRRTRTPRLYHVSETAGIERFEPRPDARGRRCVWAIGEPRLAHYLLPRDCPRVTFHARAETTAEDRAHFLRGFDAVVAIENGWIERARQTPLSLYVLDPEGFALEDEIAAYYVSCAVALPTSETRLPSALAALEAHCTSQRIELRALESLWPLREAVAGSTLGFSIIRFRNAAPPPMGFETRYPVT